MHNPLSLTAIDFLDPGRYPAEVYEPQVLARLLLDVAGYGFLAIALVFMVLNVYGVCSGLRRGRARAEVLGAAPATEGAVPRLTEDTAGAAIS